jgi:ribosomal protein S6--L-glutamate ligase
MNIAILSRSSKLYSTKRLVEAAIDRGHTVKRLDVLRTYMNITTHNPSIHYNGQPIEKFDVVIPRIGASVAFYGTAVLRQFEMTGVLPLNTSLSVSRSRDKLYTMQLLSKHGIPLPVTGFANKPGDISDMIGMVGGAPVVMKLVEGTQGMGVVLAETDKAARSVIEGFMGVKANLLVQEYVKEAKGADIRCIVIGNKVVASMKRQAPANEFRANIHRGGEASKIRISPQERLIAVRSAKILGLKFAGVDIMRSKNGPVVIEVNSSPGLEGIEKTTGVDIAGLLIAYLEKRCKKDA